MTTFVDSRRGSRAPWHLWVVGVLTLLWNGFGVYDFTMSLTQGEPYLRSMGMSDAQITYFNGMPSWTWVAWIAGVGGGLVGSILLLLRRRLALYAFAVSLLGLLAGWVYAFGMSNGAEVMGKFLPMQFVIMAACLLQLAYAWWLSRRGVLR
jgi:hypothetical protein